MTGMSRSELQVAVPKAALVQKWLKFQVLVCNYGKAKTFAWLALSWEQLLRFKLMLLKQLLPKKRSQFARWVILTCLWLRSWLMIQTHGTSFLVSVHTLQLSWTMLTSACNVELEIDIYDIKLLKSAVHYMFTLSPSLYLIYARAQLCNNVHLISDKKGHDLFQLYKWDPKSLRRSGIFIRLSMSMLSMQGSDFERQAGNVSQHQQRRAVTLALKILLHLLR